MPLFSMTGYARTQVRVNDQLGFTLALKSVNHRFLDVQMRMPSSLDAVESELRRLIKEKLVRGHVDLTISVERTAQTAAGYNRELVANYIAAFRDASVEYDLLSGGPDLNTIFRIPGALQAEPRGSNDEESQLLGAAVVAALPGVIDELKTMRAREGESLGVILNATLDRLAEATNGVATLRPQIEARYQTRLTEKLTAAVGAEFNRQRVLEEVAVMVDRSDVSEELERMHTHIGHFRELLSGGGETGKKLDFLLQEMNREANTLLSKTAGIGGKGTEITSLGLAMKAEIEKAREQIQNVE